LVPDTLLSSVRLPDQFGITGQVAGTINDYKAELYLISTDGLAHVKGSVATSAGKNKETYDVEFSTSALNVGRIIKQDSLMGSVTMSATAKGQSFDVKTMIASVNAKVSSAFIKGYRYHDIKLSAKVAGQKGDLDFISVDSNLQMQLTGHADFSGKYASAKADIKLDSIDFRALKLYSSELRASGVIHFDFPELNPDYPRGELKWWDPIITASGNRYYLDSLYIKSSPDAQNSQNIVVNLDVVQGTISGKTPLTKIVPIIEEHINRHYKFHSLDSTKNSKDAIRQLAIDTTQLPANYDLKILAHVIDKPMLHSILPGLTSFDSIHVDAALTPQYLVLNVNAPDIEYSGYSIKNCNVNVNGADSAFTYKITADKVSQGNNMTLWYADIHGNLDKNKITSTVSLCDDARKERFLLTASIEQTGDTDVIQLLPGLKLNYNVWNVAQPNRIVLANGGVYVQNFSIDNSGQYIKANSSEARINTPLKIDVTNFLLSNITESFSHNDTLLVGGILGGVITIDQMKPALKVTSDLQILQLSILGDTLGDLQATVNNKDENVLDTKVILKGEGNDIALTGSYYLQQNNGNDFNFDLNVNALALHSFETIAQNQIRRSSGYLRGKLAVKGTPSAPVIIGELTTDNLVTTVSQLNSSFRMPSEKIEFTSDGITLNNFVIHDSSDNKAVFNGTINTTDLADIQLDMKVDAQNWRVLHSTKKDNSVLFGDLLVTANLAVNGSATSPSVEGDINVLKGTNVTVVIPQPTPQMQDTKGIVVFVNMKDTGRRNVLVPEKKKPVKRKISVGSDFNVNLSVNKAAQFSLILDESSGDFLAVKGDAAINASVTAGGVISLTGTYALVGGTYQFHYNFIKRKFDIKDGSTIIFTGDPINGTTLDVTAAYVANVPSYDLVQREVTDPTQLNYYKQRLPFDVDLYMKGPVLTPQLTFNVELPDNKVYPLSTDQIQLIQAKLSQVRLDTSQLNKQVFALLILGRFVADDPFGNGVSQSATFAALQSVSTFIGEQLNNAASKLVKGVDFAVDLGTTQDYTTGNMRQRTDLNLAASKRLLNDRLKLTIGNDFELQGPQTGGSQTSLVPTDLAADYLLTSDGRYTMRAYRKTYDEGVLQGYITQTGLNFIVSLDYDNFKDAFLKKKPKKIKAKDIKAQNDSTATNK
jgi:translocation and assembly module TamB